MMEFLHNAWHSRRVYWRQTAKCALKTVNMFYSFLHVSVRQVVPKHSEWLLGQTFFITVATHVRQIVPSVIVCTYEWPYIADDKNWCKKRRQKSDCVKMKRIFIMIMKINWYCFWGIYDVKQRAFKNRARKRLSYMLCLKISSCMNYAYVLRVLRIIKLIYFSKPKIWYGWNLRNALAKVQISYEI